MGTWAGPAGVSVSLPQTDRANSFGTYTNSTGDANLVHVSVGNGQYGQTFSIDIDGERAVQPYVREQDATGETAWATVLVPAGSSYTITDQSGQTDNTVLRHNYTVLN